MFGGIGSVELVIIVIIALVLFGAPVLTFILGYSLGKKKLTDVTEARQAGEEPDEG